MPNIWWDRKRPSSVSKSHSEDNSPKTQTPRAPMKMMTATWCHHTAKTITGHVRCTYVRASRHSLWEIFVFFVPPQCAHVSLICKRKYTYIFQNEKLGKKNFFVKKKMQFPVTEAVGWYRLHVKAAIVKCLHWVGSSRLHNTQSKVKSLYSPTYIPFSTRFMMSKAFSTLPSRMSNLTS